MARWKTQLGSEVVDDFDDGLPFLPGEEGFLFEPVQEHVLGSKGKYDGFHYAGPSVPPVEPAPEAPAPGK